MASHGGVQRAEFSKVGAYASRLAGLTAFERHKLFVSDYEKYYGQGRAEGAGPGPGSEAAALSVRSDLDALRDGHRFIRTQDDDADGSAETRMCRKYYDRLFKEYGIADLSRFKESMLGVRWRTHKEVVVGKGQFTCAAKGCEERQGLASYEVNFAYMEAGQKKQALVKLRVCPDCAYKLNYKREKAYARAGASRKRRGESGQEEDEQARKVRRAADLLRGLTDEDIARAASNIAPPPEASGGGASASDAAAVAAAAEAQAQACVLPGDDSIWEAKQVQEVTAEEEFDKYFDGLFE